jgi:CHAT domain-containing protein
LGGQKGLNYIYCLNNVAENYSDLFDYNRALKLHLEIKEIKKDLQLEGQLTYAVTLNNIGMVYSKIGEYSYAEQYYKDSYKIKKRLLNRNDLSIASYYNNLGSLNSKQNKFQEALRFHKRAYRMRRRNSRIDSPDILMSINNLALSLQNLGKLRKSLIYHELNIKKRRDVFGNGHLMLAIGLDNLAGFYLENNDLSNSSIFLKEYHSIHENSFIKNHFGLEGQLHLSSKLEVDESFFRISSFIKRDSSFIDFASRSRINLNGIFDSESSNLERQIEMNGDTAVVNLMEDLKMNKKQLAKYHELTKEEKTSRGIDEKALEDKVSKQERELSKKSKEFPDFNRRFNLKDVSSALKDDEVFVDIARVPYFSTYTNHWTDSVKYLVFIHNSTDSLVEYCFIDNGKELEGEIFSDYKVECSNQDNATDLKNELYYNSFWKPIANKIGSSKTVYVSLGGVYNNINLNTLYNPETGKYLVEEKDIRIVNHARDFILSKEQAAGTYTSTSTALYGFPDYNGNETITEDTIDYLALTRDLDPLWIDSLTRGGLKAAPLPATKVEVEQIAKSFKENGWQVSEYLGDKASESNIKQEASPRVLHIATHGYFFEDIPMDKKDNERFLGMDRQRVVQDPMLRSGLLFTGANKTLQGERVDGENGLLSASEASLLDLRETELVVLSACETGKGEVKNSEGVYGLRKAFSQAGAANTIMSLWKVDDKVTQEFMTRFYEIWLNEKTTIRDAFNRTQLEIKAKYPQPYYWGAFVLVGK